MWVTIPILFLVTINTVPKYESSINYSITKYIASEKVTTTCSGQTNITTTEQESIHDNFSHKSIDLWRNNNIIRNKRTDHNT